MSGRANLAIAQAILASEALRHPGAESVRLAIDGALRRLHDVMFRLVGSAGYRALLQRAVHLAKREHAWLGNLVITAPPFAIAHLQEQVDTVGAEPAMRGGAAVLATVLDLFCTFIGEELTLRQVHQVWTELPSVEARPNPPQETT